MIFALAKECLIHYHDELLPSMTSHNLESIKCTLFPNDRFLTLSNWKTLQATISNLMKMAESSPNRFKTLWEKENFLIMSNFSFSNNVFKRLLLQTGKNQGLFGKGWTTSWIVRSLVQIESICRPQNKCKLKFVLARVENMVGKGKNTGYQHFLLFSQCFGKASISRSLKLGIVCERDILVLVF